MADDPLLSIAIASYTVERLKDIFELLDSIKAQGYSNIETIFVADGSRELLERVRKYADEKGMPNMKMVFNNGEPGVSAVRNLSIKHATGDIIAFIDDDALPFPNWAEETVKSYEDTSVIGVTGPAFPLWEDKSMDWFPEEFYWIVGGTAWFECNEIRRVRNVWGMNMSFRKEAFDSRRFLSGLGHKATDTNGVRRGIEGEETELSIRVQQGTGKSILFNPRVRVWHKVFRNRVTPKFIRRKAFWQGCTKAIIKRLHRDEGKREKVLATEYRLLRRIMLRLLPNIVKEFLSHPIVAWRRLSLTVSVLFHLTLGYFSASLPWLSRLTYPRYSS